MNKQQLFENIKKKQSFLCVGLDTDIKKIPQHLLKEEEDPIFAFNKAIIDATAPYCIAYKPNLAFYESMGVKGWLAFEKTIKYLNENYPDQFIIADAKRGDIGNTSAMYARTFFEEMQLDALTVAPYMGEDSVTPFLGYSSAPTRTSRNCRHSSRARKTASRRPASATTRPCRTTTCSSARSPTTCLPACSASAGKRSSRPRPERKKPPKWNFKLIVIP